MVKFMVKVKLIENSVNSHVGNVMVAKVIIQYSRLGITWKKMVNNQLAQPAMVEGMGGEDGRGGNWGVTGVRLAITPEAEAVGARALDRIEVMVVAGAAAEPGMTETGQ